MRPDTRTLMLRAIAWLVAIWAVAVAITFAIYFGLRAIFAAWK